MAPTGLGLACIPLIIHPIVRASRTLALPPALPLSIDRPLLATHLLHLLFHFIIPVSNMFDPFHAVLFVLSILWSCASSLENEVLASRVSCCSRPADPSVCSYACARMRPTGIMSRATGGGARIMAHRLIGLTWWGVAIRSHVHTHPLSLVPAGTRRHPHPLHTTHHPTFLRIIWWISLWTEPRGRF